MAEILGLGVSHYPGFIYPDDDMVMRVRDTLKSDKVPAALKDVRNWPAPMQAEWGDDEGTAFAARHREEFLRGARRLRAALDAFAPDVVVIFGDDQYENFREDIVPPFCVYVSDLWETRPFLHGRGRAESPPNVWGEPRDHLFSVPGHVEAGHYLTSSLMAENFDMPYAYKYLHHDGLGHAFIRVVLYLDYDRKGWTYPIIPFHVNAYGANLVRSRGGVAHLFTDDEVQSNPPPAPSPARCFALGQAVARVMRASPWRVALIASSSWSHAFLTRKNHWLYPDVEADRQRFEELQAGNYTAWRDRGLEDVVDTGQHEWLNWVPLAGAMYELGQQPTWSELAETYLMNSSKCAALFLPNAQLASAGARQVDTVV